MFSNQRCEVNVEPGCRVAVAVSGDRVESRWFVGGSSSSRRSSSSRTGRFGDENHADNDDNDDDYYLSVLRYHGDVNEVGLDARLRHDTGPVASVAPHPTDATLLVTIPAQGKNAHSATLWQAPTEAVLDTSPWRYDDEEEEEDTNGVATSRHLSSGSATNNNNSPWKQAPVSDLDMCTTLPSLTGSPMVHVAWRPAPLWDDTGSGTTGTMSSTSDVVTVDRAGHVTLWDVQTTDPSAATASAVRTMEVDEGSLKGSSGCYPPRVVWDPHATAVVAVTRGHAVHILDWRVSSSEQDNLMMVDTTTGPVTTTCAARHRRAPLLDLDYNPNRPHVLATASADGLVHVWDVRKGSSSAISTSSSSSNSNNSPLLTCRGGHSHGAHTVRYNPRHDALLLSTGGWADGRCNLWRLATVSSNPASSSLWTAGDANPLMSGTPTSGMDEDPDADGMHSVGSGAGTTPTAAASQQHNIPVTHYQHVDACYAAAWGAGSDAWIYLSVGHGDGKAVLHHVPSDEKYRILL